MKPVPVKVFVESHAAHTTQFYAGLYWLQDQGLVKVTLEKGNSRASSCISAVIHDQPVFIDLSDHSKIDKHQLQYSRFYFKRMLLKQDRADFPSLHPYGFNYPVYYKNDRTFYRSLYTHSFKKIINAFIRSNGWLSNLLHVNLGHDAARVQHFEQSPAEQDQNNQVIFSARLWNPEKPKSIEKQEHRRFINQQRIDIVKEGRKRLGKQFVGGIDYSVYAMQHAPGALVPRKAFSFKKIYLQTLRNCCIGIATSGLEDSIGFKMAEYICMSKAIVSSPICQFVLPGNFAEGNNYIGFDETADDCISKCEMLLQQNELRKELMENNYNYYQEYLRPDKLVWNIIQTTLNG